MSDSSSLPRHATACTEHNGYGQLVASEAAEITTDEPAEGAQPFAGLVTWMPQRQSQPTPDGDGGAAMQVSEPEPGGDIRDDTGDYMSAMFGQLAVDRSMGGSAGG